MSQINLDKTSLYLSVDTAVALLAFAARGKAPPQWKSVILENNTVWATDGHAAVMFTFHPRVDELPTFVAWKREHVETAMKVAKATKNEGFVLQLADASQELAANACSISGAFPPQGIKGHNIGVRLNPSHFADLEKVCKACGSGSVILDAVGDHQQPIAFTVDGTELRARVVIMPKQGVP